MAETDQREDKGRPDPNFQRGNNGRSPEDSFFSTTDPPFDWRGFRSQAFREGDAPPLRPTGTPSARAQADQLHGVKGRALPEDTTRGVGGGQPGPREQRVVAPVCVGGGRAPGAPIHWAALTC